MLRIAAIALLLCGACATVEETMTKKPPSGVYATGKRPDQFRDCIVRTQEVQQFAVSPDGDGFLFASTSVAGQVIRVLPNESGSEVTVWGLLGTRRTASACL